MHSQQGNSSCRGKQPQTKEISNLHRNLPNVVPLSRVVKILDRTGNLRFLYTICACGTRTRTGMAPP